MNFYALLKNRSKLRETGVPGTLYVFSSEEKRDEWVEASFKRIPIKNDLAKKYSPGYTAKQHNEWVKANLDKDLEEETELDPIIRERHKGRVFDTLTIFDYMRKGL